MIEAYFTVKATAFFVILGILAVIIVGGLTVQIFIKAYQWMCRRRQKRIERMMKKLVDEDQETE